MTTATIVVRPPALQRIVPAAVVCADLRGARVHIGVHPDEAPLLAAAVPARRREFAAARACARAALAELGIEPVAIPPGRRREPRWPRGVVGSLTHCAGYCAAAVARDTDVATVGIDAEINEMLPEGVRGSITTSRERDMLRSLVRHDSTVCWDRLLFSAKESVYKAWYPLTRRWLGFLDVEVRIEPEAADFAIHLPRGETSAGRLSGGWTVDNGWVRTAVAVSYDD